jgi:MSHA biogenesis protein MshK
MRHLRAMVFLAVVPWALTAGAQGLVDPTRPPGALAAGGDAAATSGPVLQSVMLSQGRKMAMISGELVVLGGRYGSARLVKLTESEAVLKDGAETTVLKLFPLVEKRMAGDVKKSAARITK